MTERWVWNCTFTNDAGSWTDSALCPARSRVTFPSEAKAQAALDRHLQKANHLWRSGRGGFTFKVGLVWKLKKGQRWTR